MRSIRSMLALRKRIFICHASEKYDAEIAESIAIRLRRLGFKVFFDKDNLRPGHAFDDHILREIIGGCSAFVFLISPDSVAPGRYTLTEMEFAKRRWPDPSGAVLPVLIAKTDMQSIPPYLRAVSFSETQGNVVAKVAAEVAKLVRPINLLPITGALSAAILLLAVGAYAYFKPHTPICPDGKVASADSTSCNSYTEPKPITNTDPPSTGGTQFPDNFELIFTLDLSDDSPDLATDQVRIAEPSKMWDNYLSLHPDGYYAERFDTPTSTSSFAAFVTRKVTNSYKGQPQITSFCLHRADHPPEKAKVDSVVLRCKEGDHPCASFAADDQGLLALSSACTRLGPPKKSGSLGAAPSFAGLIVPAAIAATDDRVWSIPSLDSLLTRKTANELRDGFTVFTIESAAKLDIEADAVALDLMVNETPALIEGLPAELQPRHFDPNQPLKVEFGLQNLDFEGRHAGCDRIISRLLFFKAGEPVGTPITLELLYAALRNVDRTVISTGPGTFTWSARYNISNPDNKRTDWRVFVNSASHGELPKLVQMRQKIDDLGLIYSADGKDYPVHAILRPPLRGNWGLALGLVQPSGQIRFTFTNEEAHAIKKFADDKRRSVPAVKQLFEDTPDLYQEPVDVDRRYSCGH
jgi:hypothetical protein